MNIEQTFITLSVAEGNTKELAKAKFDRHIAVQGVRWVRSQLGAMAYRIEANRAYEATLAKVNGSAESEIAKILKAIK